MLAIEALDAAEGACCAGDVRALQRQLHRIKGDASMLQLHSLAAYAELIYDSVNARISKSEEGALFSALQSMREWIEEHLVEDEEACERLAQGSLNLNMGASNHVLVVDDSAVSRMVLAASLRARGVEVETVGNALDSLDAISRRRPRLILSDVQMPGVDGFELIERLRAQELGLPVVLVSGDVEEHTKARAKEVGALEVFLKSADLSELVDFVLRECLAPPASVRRERC